jgi:GNAT superfamily N-acetyltransferase
LGEASRIGELHALIQGAFRDLSIEPPSGVLKETVEDFSERLKAETAIVAESVDALIGGVFCAPKKDTLYIGRLAVRQTWRRRGVATALLDAAKAESRRLGIDRLTLNTRIALESNVALFSKHGFLVTGAQCHSGFTRPTFYEMELRLQKK